MKLAGTFLCIFFIQYAAWSQNNIDSLTYYAAHSKDDTASLNRLINYCFVHREEMPDQAYVYSKEAVSASKKLGSKRAEARSITNLGAIEVQKGNYPAALAHYLESLAIWESLQDPRGIMLSKNNIAQVYGHLKKTDAELRFLKEAEAIAKQYHLEDELGLIKTNLSVYYSNKGNFKQALAEQLEALAINLKLNKLSLASLDYSNAGAYLFYLHKMDSAILLYRQSKDIGEKIHDQRTIAISWANLAEAYGVKGMADTAIAYYNKAISIAVPIGLKDILSFSYAQLAGLYKQKGDYVKALHFTELQQVVKDSILNSTATKQLAEMETKYESSKKEKRIVEQELEISKRNSLIVGLVIFFVLLGLLFFALSYRKKLKREAEVQATLRKAEEQAARAVLDAEEKERIRVAVELHDGVGQMMSVAKMNLSAIESEIPFVNDDQKSRFDKAISLVDESCSEVRAVSHNLMPNALLKSGLGTAVRTFLDNMKDGSIRVNLYVDGLDEKIDSNTETVLYRVIQESVNNVIKHAAASQLDISLIGEGDTISATIEDNGKGFLVSDIAGKDGIGLKNIQSRVAYLKGTVEWDSAPGKGTVVVVNIPYVKAVS